jgi:hypothetical protein
MEAIAVSVHLQGGFKIHELLSGHHNTIASWGSI